MASPDATIPFAQRQPSYWRAILQPSSLDGYEAKQANLPRWLDYALFGPPAVRDSSPGAMAYIFGRTEHDVKWNPKKKGPLTRGFNAIFLIASYIFFCVLPCAHARRTLSRLLVFLRGMTVSPLHACAQVFGDLCARHRAIPSRAVGDADGTNLCGGVRAPLRARL